MISDLLLEQLRNTCSIESVVSNYVELKPSGAGRMAGLCPFHAEKSPSMVVYLSTQSFYCFGCGVGGDMVSFTMKIESLEYVDALKFLCRRANIEFPELGARFGASKNTRKRILEANLVAARFFYDSLQKSEDAKKYLMEKRGLSSRTIKQFGLGFAPSDGQLANNHLCELGYSVRELLEAGLVSKKRNGSLCDTFRNRVIFPIINTRAEVIGFGGRVLGDGQPKYLNSADSIVFKKSNNLFNLARAGSFKKQVVILVEGYLDVISLVQAGINNAVATLGTALTPNQARLISSYAKKVVLAYDSDAAGIKASQRAVNILNDSGLDVLVLDLGECKDPDEFVKKHGASQFMDACERAVSAFEFELQTMKKHFNLAKTEGKSAFLKEAAKWLSKITNQIDREVFLGKICSEFEVDRSVLGSFVNSLIKRDIKALNQRNKHNLTSKLISVGREGEGVVPASCVKAEELIICAVFRNPDLGKMIDKVYVESLFLTKNKDIYSILAERLRQNLSNELIFLNSVLENKLFENLSGILARNAEQALTKEVVIECTQTLSQFRKKKTSTELSKMSSLELKDYLETVYKQKK